MSKNAVAVPILLLLSVCADVDAVEPTTDKDKTVQETERSGGLSALEKLRSLAEQGNVHAQHDLGRSYANGVEVRQDDQEALKWYRLAAHQSHPQSQYALGHAYAYGTGIEQDFVEAVRWYKLAADQGHPASQHNLAGMYYRGNGVLQNYSEAIKWFRLAASNRNAASLVNLGIMYENGLGTDQDAAAAAKWYWLSSEQGDPIALNQLGLMYAKGDYLPRNYVTAAMYFLIAIANGSEKALQNRNKVSSIISDEDFSRAQHMAADWIADHSARKSENVGYYLGTRPDISEQSTDPSPVISAFGFSLKMTPFEVKLRKGDSIFMSQTPKSDGSTEYQETWVYYDGDIRNQRIEVILSGDDPQSMTVAVVCRLGGKNDLLGITNGDLESSVVDTLGYPDSIYWHQNGEGKHLSYTQWGVAFETRNGRVSQACIFDSKSMSFRR